MSEELQTMSNTMALAASEVVNRTRLVAEVMKAVMEENVHYGTIPGTKKPSLWQPGAEKLLMTFQLSPKVIVQDQSTEDSVAYLVTVEVHDRNERLVGTGVGYCSSDEEKYRWRGAVCEAEWLEADPDHRRKKWVNAQKPYTVAQIRTNPKDIANTVLKMAKKRAIVDGAKSSCAASDFFDQDLEDYPLPLNEERAAEKPKRTVAQPRPVQKEQEPEGRRDEPLILPAEEPEPEKSVSAEWQDISAKWHSKGVVSAKQLNRLFALARATGWTSDSVRARLSEELAVDAEQIPWGAPYDAVVEWFQRHSPGA